MIGLDYVGLATLISALGATITGIIVAFRQSATHARVADVQNSVKMSNGSTIAQAVERIGSDNPGTPTPPAAT